MKKNYIRLFLLIAVFAFAFTLASCGDISNSIQLDFEKTSYDLELGDNLTLEPILKNAGETNYKFQWDVEDDTVVECNEGELTAVGVGSTTVKVWIEGKKYIAATAEIDVYEIIDMPDATFDVEGPAGLEGNLYIGDENKLVYEYSHQNPNVEMQFSSSNEKVATIDAEGNITALAKGKVVFTAKIVDKKNTDQYLEYKFEYKVLNIYNITLNLEGGELEEEFENQFRAGEEVITLPTPVKTGYNFLGWYGNKNLAGNAVETVDTSNAHDYLFYAKWEVAKYTLTYADTNETVEYTYFDEFELPTRSKTGWKFLGWAIVDENGEANEELDALITEIAYGTSGDLTITPIFGEFKIRVAETFDTSKDYVLGMYQGNKKQTLYMTGTLSGYYGATTTSFASAAKLNVVETTGGYYLKLTLTNGSVKYICLEKSGSYNNIKFNASPSTVWQYNEQYNTFTAKLGSDTLFLGTYNTYTTFSASYSSYLSSSTNYISHLYEEVLVTDEMRGEEVLDNISIEKNLVEDYKLPQVENVTFALAEDYENAKIENGVLKVTRPENFDGDAVIKLVGTCKYNKAVATKVYEIVIVAKDPEDVKSVVVTDEALGLGNYADGSKVITGVKFDYIQLGKYNNDDIQMRYKNNIHSSIANATAFTKKLEKVIITLTTGRTGYNNKDALLIEFGTDNSYSDYATTMSTVSGQAVYEIYPDTQHYTYVSISHNMPSYTVYVASIEYVYVSEPELCEQYTFGSLNLTGYTNNKSLSVKEELSGKSVTITGHQAQITNSTNDPHKNTGSFGVLCPTRKNNSTKNSFFEFKFNEAVSRIKFDVSWWSSSDKSSHASKIKKFEVQYSTDGKTWTSVDLGSASKIDATKYTEIVVDLVDAKYVRIYTEASSTYTSNQNARIAIDNVEFFR